MQGYSYEVMVTAGKGSTVLPLLASADTASVSEHVSFAGKIESLPASTKNVLADSGYDNNDYGERIERDPQGRRTGRRFICPANPRNTRQNNKNSEPAPAAVNGSSQRYRRQRITFYH